MVCVGGDANAMRKCKTEVDRARIVVLSLSGVKLVQMVLTYISDFMAWCVACSHRQIAINNMAMRALTTASFHASDMNIVFAVCLFQSLSVRQADHQSRRMAVDDFHRQLMGYTLQTDEG